ncbi:hypothetical protein M8818_006634 [Zalaria obscura]|uniref:Uncharacterized protein n=1 Tax=Zalaria obscura TaxID=2024903 RepID=A0ACC3S6B9_9PEZI
MIALSTLRNMRASTFAVGFLTALTLLAPQVAAHSWLEQMQVIDSSGNFTGDYGYPRGYVARTDPSFTGNSMDYLLPSLASGRTRINEDDLLCHPSQRTQTQSSDYPRLSVTPGGYVVMKYLENGHVTLPQNQKGKPKAAGTVFVYGTTSPSDDEKIANVLEWTQDGSGGNGKGYLISAQNFDDGRCHQLNSGTISQQRQQEFPDRVPGQPTSNVEQWCETDLEIPSSAKTGETLTLYWVWQWPTAPGADSTIPHGKDEYYTTCADVEVIGGSIKAEKPFHTLVQQDPQTTACSDFTDRTAYTTSPAITLASGTGSAPTSAAATTAPSSARAGTATSSSASVATPTPNSGKGISSLPLNPLQANTQIFNPITSVAYSAPPPEFTYAPTSSSVKLPEITFVPSKPFTGGDDDDVVTVTNMVTVTQTIGAAPAAPTPAGQAADAVVGANGVVNEHIKRHMHMRHGAKFRF